MGQPLTIPKCPFSGGQHESDKCKAVPAGRGRKRLDVFHEAQHATEELNAVQTGHPLRSAIGQRYAIMKV